MNNLVYALRDFFEFTFRLMEPIGNAFNLAAILVITFFIVYWIRQMLGHSEKKGS